MEIFKQLLAILTAMEVILVSFTFHQFNIKNETQLQICMMTLGSRVSLQLQLIYVTISMSLWHNA